MKIFLVPLIVITVFSIGISQAYANINQPEAEQIVEQMRGFSMIYDGWGAPSDGKYGLIAKRRQEILDKLRQLGNEALPALSHALSDPDVQMRRNAELVLIYWPGDYASYKKIAPQQVLPALVKNTEDKDADVRAWAATAIGGTGANAKKLVPVLIKLLKDPQEGPRNNSCNALAEIGPAAKEALPALKEALNDPSKDVRQFAQRAITKIENK